MAIEQEELPTFGIGDRLRKAREMRGFTLEYMERELTRLGRKASSSAISDWERGKQPRRLTFTVKLWAQITNLPEDWFYSQLWSELTLVPMPSGQMELSLAYHGERFPLAEAV